MRNQPCGAVVYGIDLGKTSFHVVGLDVAGRPIQRLKLGRTTIFRFFGNASAALIGMEACPGSQWLARKLQAFGHTVRIIPAQFVKPYIKSNKRHNRRRSHRRSGQPSHDAICPGEADRAGGPSSAAPGT